MSFSQLLIILRARWKRILLLWFGLIALAVLVSLALPKTYLARAEVVLDVRAPDPVNGGMVPGLMTPSYMATQIDVIQSRRVVERAIKAMQLDQNAELIQKWRENTDGVGDMAFWLYQWVSKGLDINPSRDSNLVAVGFKSADPQFAAEMANAIVQAFISTSLDMKVSPAGENAAWFKEQLETMRKDVDAAQQKISAFRIEKQLIGDPQGRIDAETSQLNQLAAELTAARAANADASSRRSSKRDLASSPEVLQNPLIANLRMSLAEARNQLEQARSRLGSAHPDVRRLTAQVQELSSELGAQTSRIVSSLSISQEQSAEKVGLLEKQLADQQQRVIALNADMDRLGVLQNELKAAQGAYNAVSERYLQTNLQSQNQLTNITLLTPAVAPLRPASPRPVVNVAVAMLLGLVLGLGSAFVSEMMDRRIRGEDDFEGDYGLPITLLGTVPNRKEGGSDWSPGSSDRRLAGPRSSGALPSP